MSCEFVSGKNFNAFYCSRGFRSKTVAFHGKVKDRQGNIWYVRQNKKEFEFSPKVTVFSKNGESKRFLRTYLEWVE